jgi:uncharacterized protein YecE (DUF72 family)
MARAYIGTSGWNYKHWSNGVFYPPEVKPAQWLDFFVRHFDTVEINNSFYRLPGEDVFKKWRRQAPKNFVFSVKASRFITHIKRLKDPEEPLALLHSRVKHLRTALGPVLFQLPPRFKADLERLGRFLNALEKKRRYAIEVRDKTWLVPEVFDLLKRFRVALCLADWRDLHVNGPVTTDFVYVRRHHGPLSGNYGKRHLDRDVRQVREWLASGMDVYVYFNNDLKGDAIRNAGYVRNALCLSPE